MSNVWSICDGYTQSMIAAHVGGWMRCSMAETREEDAAISPQERAAGSGFMVPVCAKGVGS